HGREGGVPDRRGARAAGRVVRRGQGGAGDGRGQRPGGRGAGVRGVPAAAVRGGGGEPDGAGGARQLPAAEGAAGADGGGVTASGVALAPGSSLNWSSARLPV